MKPKRIFLIRHGESEGNIDKSIYIHKPDYALKLSKKGVEQAKEAGRKIKNTIKLETYGVYYSPFFRARQTMDLATDELGTDYCLFKKEEPRLREQEWSHGLRDKNVDIDKIQSDRDLYGHFYYRFYGGESCADTFDRVSDYLHTLHRDFEKDNFPDNCLIFGHGMTNRLFLMRWLHATVEQFEQWANPSNGQIWVLEKGDRDKYSLTTVLKNHIIKHNYQYKL